MNGTFKDKNLWRLYKESSDLTHQLTQIAFHSYEGGDYEKQIERVKSRLTDMGIYAAMLANEAGGQND